MGQAGDEQAHRSTPQSAQTDARRLIDATLQCLPTAAAGHTAASPQGPPRLQVRVVCSHAAAAALEESGVDGVEAGDGGEEAEVGLGEALAAQEALAAARRGRRQGQVAWTGREAAGSEAC